MLIDSVKTNISPIVKSRLISNSIAYENFYLVLKFIGNYTEKPNKKSENELRTILDWCKENYMPLPSGKWGNILAVALEMHRYVGALFIIENAQEFEIDLNNISCDSNKENFFSAKEIFNSSLLTFEDENILLDWADEMPDKNRSYLEKNIEAAETVKDYLGVQLTLTK